MPVELRATTGTVARALLEGRVVHIPDVQGRPGLHLGRGAASWAAFAPCSASRCCARGRRSAFWRLTRTEVRPFTDKQIELVTTFADQSVLAIQNVRLFEEIEEKSQPARESRASTSRSSSPT